MKLASYKLNGKGSFGLVTDKGIVDLAEAYPGVVDLKALIAAGLDISRLQLLADEAVSFIGEDDVEFLPVIPNPEAIFCVGMNTYTHVDEIAKVSGRRHIPQKPALFMRTQRSQVAHKQAIEKPNNSPLLDYEGEIAVIIGKPCRHVSPEEALDYVAGYACYNDGSVRDYQLHSHMFTSGKNFPRTGGFGPYLTTADEAGNPDTFTVETRVNGEVKQTLNYSDLIYSFGQIISYASEFDQLQPGDVFVTGSPAGSALFSRPQHWLTVGDVVEISSPQLGTLVNTIKNAEGMNVAPETRSDSEKVFHEALEFAKNR